MTPRTPTVRAPARIGWTPGARVIEVIEVTFLRGKGVVGDPVREVTVYFAADGTRLAVNDPVPAEALEAPHERPA